MGCWPLRWLWNAWTCNVSYPPRLRWHVHAHRLGLRTVCRRRRDTLHHFWPVDSLSLIYIYRGSSYPLNCLLSLKHRRRGWLFLIFLLFIGNILIFSLINYYNLVGGGIFSQKYLGGFLIRVIFSIRVILLCVNVQIWYFVELLDKKGSLLILSVIDRIFWLVSIGSFSRPWEYKFLINIRCMKFLFDLFFELDQLSLYLGIDVSLLL